MKQVLKITTMILAVAAVLAACRKEEPENTMQKDQMVKNVIVPATTFYTAATPSLTIQGKGFEAGDKLSLLDAKPSELSLSITDIEPNYVTFKVPANIQSGEFILLLRRGDRLQRLGVLRLRVSPELTVEDKINASVKGVVFCGKDPIPGAVVSDGHDVTVTDENGHYWLASDKHHGYVFVTLPSGYEPLRDGCLPLIWSNLEKEADVIEQHNFELLKVDNTEHVMMVFADMHLANRDNMDLNQFDTYFGQDVAKTADETYAGKRVYAMNVGDMSWDSYWYSGQWGVVRYDIQRYLNNIQSKNFSFPVFHLPGNHDNDPYMKTDYLAEEPYKKTLGPTYYSFNLGDVHYVMLDDVIYVNNGANPPSGKGDMSYKAALTDIQLEWLKNDLALVDKSKPLVVGLHCPGYYSNNSTFAVRTHFDTALDHVKMMACFTGFTDLHFVSGHMHNNINTPVSDNVYEHTVGAVCATWWWTGFLTGAQGWRNISKDGSPGGYAVFEMDGTDMEWYYKGSNEPREKQFRTYDMNAVKTFFATNPNAQRYFISYPERAGDYNNVGGNVVFINVWNWDPEWKITVKEGDQELTVKRIYHRDPLHVITYDLPNYVKYNTVNESFMTTGNIHMFSVNCSTASSTLRIEVEDRFGNIYTEQMLRPKDFNVEMD